MTTQKKPLDSGPDPTDTQDMTTTQVARGRWRDVPMPPKIAQMKRHPRSGFPVPYVAQRWAIKVPPPVDKRWGMIATPDRSTDDLDLGHMDEQRQRDCMYRRRCQVCHVALGDGPYYFCGGVGTRPLRDFAFREPPVCPTCLDYALRVCPGLVRGRRNTDLRVVEAVSYDLYEERHVGTGLATFGPEGSSPPAVRLGTVLFFFRAQTAGVVMTPEDFLEESTVRP